MGKTKIKNSTDLANHLLPLSVGFLSSSVKKNNIKNKDVEREKKKKKRTDNIHRVL